MRLNLTVSVLCHRSYEVSADCTIYITACSDNIVTSYSSFLITGKFNVPCHNNLSVSSLVANFIIRSISIRSYIRFNVVYQIASKSNMTIVGPLLQDIYLIVRFRAMLH